MIAEGLAALAKLGETGRVAGKRAFARLLGQDVPLEVEYSETVEIEELYRRKFERVFGYFPEGRAVEIHSIRLLVAGASPSGEEETFPDGPLRGAGASLSREEIAPGESLAGPCLVADDFGTLWIEEGWTARKGTRGSLLLEADESEGPGVSFPTAARRELFASRFLCLVDEMGAQLERTALSVNVRERLDFSCALLDGAGYLVATPHIGSTPSDGPRAGRLLELSDLGPGTPSLQSPPGGSHLPDATVLAPVFGTGDKPFCLPPTGPPCRDEGPPAPCPREQPLLEEGVASPHACFSRAAVDDGWLGQILLKALSSRQPAENWPTFPPSRPPAGE